MKDELLKFVIQFPTIKEEARAIANDLNARSCEKGTILLREGEINCRKLKLPILPIDMFW